LPYFMYYICVAHFSWFWIFSPYSRSCSVHFSFSMVCSVSCHILLATVYFSHFNDFQFSVHIPDHRVCISHFPTFSVFLSIIQVLQGVFLIFHVFQCFSPYFTSYFVCFSLSMIFSFLAILHVLQCVFLIFHDF
jgi:hypothetical protein